MAPWMILMIICWHFNHLNNKPMLKDPYFKLKQTVQDVRRSMQDYEHIMADCDYSGLLTDLNEGGLGVKHLQGAGYEMYSVLFYLLYDDDFHPELLTEKGRHTLDALIRSLFTQTRQSYLMSMWTAHLTHDDKDDPLPKEAYQDMSQLKARHLTQYSAAHIKVYPLHHWEDAKHGKTQRQWNLLFDVVPNSHQIQGILDRAQQLYPAGTDIIGLKMTEKQLVFCVISTLHAGSDPIMFATRRWLGYIRNTNLGLVAINGQDIHDWRDYLWDDLPDEPMRQNDN